MMEQPVKKQRLEWLDALRGFTMILVVAFHVGLHGFELPTRMSSSMNFLVLFRMPLFFFVSGFLAYKAGRTWNLRTLRQLIVKKIEIQTIPTIVFFFFAAMVLGSNFQETVMSWLILPTKGGYWFTIVLLYMFIVYYLFSYIESKFFRCLSPQAARRISWVPIVLLFVVSLLFYESCYLPRIFVWAQGHRGARSDFMDYSSLGQLFMYFPFFLYGNIVRRYWDTAQRVMDSRWFYPVIVVIVIFAALDSQQWHVLRMEWAILPLTLARFMLLTMVFMYFRYYHQYFTKMTWVGRSLQYIGRRTLDIYLIHFLFMPQLPIVGEFFKTYRHNFVMDTTLSVLIAIIIIGFCIITSNILRVSPFFRKWLFGRT
ncbi:MAG: acyltransferase [Prevotella sp.]|nr:acyltransferase [Prevotella sp.]